jgi:nicotinate dehydrogenase subunit A
VNINVNGQVRSCDAPANTRSVFVLRNDLGLCGVKLGCGEGHCGACTVLVDGRPVTTCDLPLWALEGKAVRTLEGLGTPEAPHPVQAAFLQEQAAQCGFCLSGVILTAKAFLDQNPKAGEAQIRQALAGVLCRCFVHTRMLRAIVRYSQGA